MLLSELLATPGWPFLTVDFDNKGYSIETLWDLLASNLNLTLKSFCWRKVLQLSWSYQVQITMFQVPPKKNTDLLFVSETHQPPLKENRRKPPRLRERLATWSVSRLQCSQLMRRPCCSRMHCKSRRIKFTGLREKVGRKRWCVFSQGARSYIETIQLQQHKWFTHSNQMKKIYEVFYWFLIVGVGVCLEGIIW